MRFGLQDDIIEKLVKVFEANPKVDKAYVFGSRAKGNYRDDSDIDIALKGYQLTLDDMLKMSVAFDDKGIKYKIDLLDYNEIKEPELLGHIDRVGVEFYRRWKEHKLGELIEVINGYAFKSADFLDNYQSGALPVIKIKNVANGDVHLNDVQFHFYYDKLLKYTAEMDDVLISLTGNHPELQTQVVGLVSKYKFELRAFINQRVAKLLSNTDKLANEYLYYFLKDEDTHQYIASQSSGSANQANISKNDIENIPISLPPLVEQQCIAAILKCLDNKIDLLNRQNKTLEQLAETLFRQWFVEEAEQQSERQLILGDLITTISTTHKFPDDHIVFLNTSDIYLGDVLVHEPVAVNNLPGQAKKSMRRDDILFSEIRPANGRYAYVDFDASNYVASTKLMVLRSKGIVSQAFIYFYLSHPQTLEWLQVLAESRSGTFPQITFDQIKDLKINIPNEFILKNALSFCDDAIKKIKKNKAQIRSLINMRDTLLPKLMSGEVRVQMPQ